MKRTLSLLLSAAVALSLLTGCGPKTTGSDSSSGSGSGSSSGDVSSSGAYVLPNFMVLSGPTGVGAAKLLADDAAIADGTASAGEMKEVVDHFEVVANNQEVKDALISGTTDIAAIATNEAAALAAKTDGAVQVLAVNTLGVLYILEKGNTVYSLADLAGKTVYATGQGANPEYVLNYLLRQSGVQPSQVDIQWMTAQEVSAKMATSEEAICMLPVPAATALLIQDSGVRQALSLSEVWDELGSGQLAMGCVVVRTEYLEENPQGVEAFLDAYEDSLNYMMDEANLEQAAQYVAQFEITPSAAIAQKAIPQCSLTYITGGEMRDMLESYYQVLFQANPDSIGGSMPYDSFYYEG